MNYGLILVILIIMLIITLTLIIILIIGELLDNDNQHKSGLITFTTFLSTLIIGGIIVLYTYSVAKSRLTGDDQVEEDTTNYGLQFIEDILL